MTPAEWRKARKAARKRHRDAETGYAGAAGVVQRPESVRRPAPAHPPGQPKGKTSATVGARLAHSLCGVETPAIGERVHGGTASRQPGRAPTGTDPNLGKRSDKRGNHRGVDRGRVHVQGIGQSHSPDRGRIPGAQPAGAGMREREQRDLGGRRRRPQRPRLHGVSRRGPRSAPRGPHRGGDLVRRAVRPVDIDERWVRLSPSHARRTPSGRPREASRHSAVRFDLTHLCVPLWTATGRQLELLSTVPLRTACSRRPARLADAPATERLAALSETKNPPGVAPA